MKKSRMINEGNTGAGRDRETGISGRGRREENLLRLTAYRNRITHVLKAGFPIVPATQLPGE